MLLLLCKWVAKGCFGVTVKIISAAHLHKTDARRHLDCRPGLSCETKDGISGIVLVIHKKWRCSKAEAPTIAINFSFPKHKLKQIQ